MNDGHINNEWMKVSIDHLSRAGLKEGVTIWYIGCKTGSILTYLSKTVGDVGKVFALNNNKDDLLEAKKFAEEEGLNNIIFIEDDITSESILPKGEADIVYMNCVLLYLPDKLKALQNIKFLLKINGVVASSESVIDPFDSIKNVFKQYAEDLINLGMYKNANIPNLQNFYKDAGYNSIEEKNIWLEFPFKSDRAGELLSRALSECKDKAINEGFITHEQVDIWNEELKNLPEKMNPKAKITCIIARN